MVDRTTKLLLIAIACGLWLHVVGEWLRPTPVQAQAAPLTYSLKQTDMVNELKGIHADTSAMKETLRLIWVTGRK